MKKILLLLLAAALFLTAGCGQTKQMEPPIEPLDSVSITIETKEVEFTSESGGDTYVFHYDLPSVSGESVQAEMLNDMFMQDFEDFSNAAGRHEFIDILLGIESESENGYYPLEVTTEVVHNGDGILSVCYTADYYYDCECAYGMTFDLATGESAPITACFPVDEDVLSDRIQSLFKSMDNREDDVALSMVIEDYLNSFDLASLDYIIRDDELVVIISDVRYADGARLTYFVPCGIMLDGTVIELDDGIPDTLSDYLGMSINDLAQIWGDDYSQDEGLYLGSAKSVYYADNRVPVVFYFDDPLNQGVKTGNERINLVTTKSFNGMAAEGLSCNTSYAELSALDLKGEYEEFQDSENSATYTFQVDDNTYVIYEWWYGEDPKTVKPSVSVYRTGLEAELPEENQAHPGSGTYEEDSADSSSSSGIMSYLGIWHDQEELMPSELNIKDINNDGVQFDLFVAHFCELQNIRASFVYDGAASYSSSDGMTDVTLYFDEGYIIVSVETIPLGSEAEGERYSFDFTFPIHDNVSLF